MDTYDAAQASEAPDFSMPCILFQVTLFKFCCVLDRWYLLFVHLCCALSTLWTWTTRASCNCRIDSITTMSARVETDAAAKAASKAAKEAAAVAARQQAQQHLKATGAGHYDPYTASNAITMHGDNTLKRLAAERNSASSSASSNVSAATQKSLPAGWKSVPDAVNGKTYYYEISSGKTQWHFPTALDSTASSSSTPTSNAAAGSGTAADGAGSSLPAGWFAAVDGGSNKTYYYTASGTRQWDLPTTPAPAAALHSPATTGAGARPQGLANAPSRFAAGTGANSAPLGKPGGSSGSGSATAGSKFNFVPRAAGGHGSRPRPGAGGSSSGGRGGEYAGNKRKLESSADDPLDPTGTGGRWSDGLEAAERMAAAKALKAQQEKLASAAGGGSADAAEIGPSMPTPSFS